MRTLLNEFTVNVMLEANPELTPVELFFRGTMKDKQYIEEASIEFEEYIKHKEDVK